MSGNLAGIANQAPSRKATVALGRLAGLPGSRGRRGVLAGGLTTVQGLYPERADSLYTGSAARCPSTDLKSAYAFNPPSRFSR